jgi:purine-binding chemotaxis protein CheW
MSELLEHQYLSFSLVSELYAIPVSRVLEVLECTRITKLPCQKRYLMGLIDLRGRGIPVLDLRLCFKMEEAEVTKDSAVVVVELAGREGAAVVGLLADSVHEVMEIDPGKIDEAPRFGAGPAGGFLQGIGRMEESFFLILDLDKLFSTEEVEAVCAPSSPTITV